MTLALEFPEKKHEYMYDTLVIEWAKAENIDKISPGALFYGENFNEFLKEIELIKKTPPKGYTNSSLLFLVENSNILGGIDIRHDIISPILAEKGGHIGYGIAPKYRRQGYASKILELGLIEAKKLGLTKILICCYTNNIGSNKVILNNGGIFERLTDDGKANRYWIHL